MTARIFKISPRPFLSTFVYKQSFSVAKRQIFKIMGSSAAKPLNPEVEKFVVDTIAKDRVVIFSKISCPYCSMAKKQFQKLDVKYSAIEIGHRADASEIQDVLSNLTGARTVPRVFVDGKFIGGGSDVKKLYETGELAKMLS